MKISQAALTLGLMLMAPAHATQVELILDASGSMYNKLASGQSRIQAAREVLSGFVASLPEDPDLNVGLRIYGAQLSPGSTCEDSQLVLPLSGLNRTQLQDTVQKTTPRGATPIAYSLLQAAEDFSQNDEKKVIVLVTDGQESCGGDLKAAMNAFKTRGIDVALHVIGIDLDAKAQQTFQGLGTFENTTSATGLAQALGNAVQQVVKPDNQKVNVQIQLTREGQPAQVGSTVTLLPLTGNPIVLNRGSTPGLFTQDVPTGIYSVQINTTSGVRTYSGLVMNPGQDNLYRFEIPDLKRLVSLTLEPVRPVMGGMVTVYMQNVPDDGKDGHLTLVRPEQADFVTGEEYYVGNQNGTVNIRLPESPETVEFRYYRVLPDRTVQVLGRSAPFSPLDVPATLKIPAQVTAGDLVPITWTGPGNDPDYITVVRPDAPDGIIDQSQAYNVSGTGGVMTLRLEPVEGQFELRYMTRAGRVLGRQAFTAKLAQYQVSAPRKVKVAEKFPLSFKGTGQPWDYVGIVKKDSPELWDNQWSTSISDQREGSITFTAPQEPGEYQVIYYSTRAEKRFAVQDLTVEGVNYQLTAAASVPAGMPVQVKWVGAGADKDFITLVPKDTVEGNVDSSQMVRVTDGNPVVFTAPLEQGEYEIRYVSGDLNFKTQATVPLQVTAAQITLTYPAQVMAGSVLKVTFKSANNNGDYIALVPKDSPDGTYLEYASTGGGSPVLIPTPEMPGDYEVRYMNRNGDLVLYRQPLTLVEPKANLKGPSTGKAGGSIKVIWSGPAGEKDQVVLARKGADAGDFISNYSVGQALQLDISLPGEAGDYEVRYLTGGGTVLVTLPVKVQ